MVPYYQRWMEALPTVESLAAVDDVSLASLDAGGTEDSGVLDSFVEDVVFPQAARLNAIAKHKKIAVSFFIMILHFLY
mgnify:CR=1 FL=1